MQHFLTDAVGVATRQLDATGPRYSIEFVRQCFASLPLGRTSNAAHCRLDGGQCPGKLGNIFYEGELAHGVSLYLPIAANAARIVAWDMRTASIRAWFPHPGRNS